MQSNRLPVNGQWAELLYHRTDGYINIYSTYLSFQAVSSTIGSCYGVTKICDLKRNTELLLTYEDRHVKFEEHLYRLQLVNKPINEFLVWDSMRETVNWNGDIYCCKESQKFFSCTESVRCLYLSKLRQLLARVMHSPGQNICCWSTEGLLVHVFSSGTL